MLKKIQALQNEKDNNLTLIIDMERDMKRIKEEKNKFSSENAKFAEDILKLQDQLSFLKYDCAFCIDYKFDIFFNPEKLLIFDWHIGHSMSTALFFFITLDFNSLILECNYRLGVINICATNSFRTSKILSNAKGCQLDNTLLKQRCIKSWDCLNFNFLPFLISLSGRSNRYAPNYVISTPKNK